MASTADRRAIVVAGGGAVGLSAALALRQAVGTRYPVIVYDPALAREPLHEKGRAYALAGGSRRMLSVLGVWERIAADDLVIVLSDGFDDGCIALAERLAAARREVIFIQLLTAEERDFPFTGGHLFHDPETGQTVSGDGKAMRAEFLQQFNRALQMLDARLDAAGIVHVRHVLDAPLDIPLRQLFGKHARP